MADEEAEEGGGGGSKLIIIIVAVVVLLAGGGGAAFFLMSGGEEEEGPTEFVEEGADLPPPPPDAQAYYVSMPNAFIFNVRGEKRDRLVQINVQLMVRGAENQKLATDNIPTLEGVLLDVFSSATAEELGTVNGQERVREDALVAVQNKLQEVLEQTVVERILFTGFVMQ